MEKKYDVTALGELLIDFTENGVSDQGNALFEANPGGAPCNVLAMLNNLGKKTNFIGKVGNDQFGRLLKDSLTELNIGTDSLYMDKDVNTTLAFVHTFADGDRDFSFYRKPGADMMLNMAEISEKEIAASKIFHFGSLSLTDEPVKSATLKALEYAKKNNVLITFDPNLRPPLWNSLKRAKDEIRIGLSCCQAVKMSEEELEFLTGEKDLDDGMKILKEQFPIPLVCITMGKKGSCAFYKDKKVSCRGFVQEKTIETTGAGDTFCACMINYLLEHDLGSLTESSLLEMLTYANAAASIITTRKGALRVMPTKQEIAEILENNRNGED